MVDLKDLKVGQYILFDGLKATVKCVKKEGEFCEIISPLDLKFTVCCVEREDGIKGVGCKKYWVLYKYPNGDKTYIFLKILGETNPNSKIIIRK